MTAQEIQIAMLRVKIAPSSGAEQLDAFNTTAAAHALQLSPLSFD